MSYLAKQLIYTIFIYALFTVTGCISSDANGTDEVEQGDSTQEEVFKLHGLNFSPYMEGQDPNHGSYIELSQLAARMEIITPHVLWIRNFGMADGLEHSGMVAHALGLKAALGAWISSDLEENERQLTWLIDAVQAGEADMMIIGSEVLLRDDLSEDKLLEYIQRVKKQIESVPVAYADAYSEFLAHPNVVDAVDVVLVNYYPYWEGIHIENAVGAIHAWHKQVLEIAVDKPVIVSETGWPSDGSTVGQAIPSQDNASFFFLNFVSWARAEGVDYFYFEAFDEAWKAAYEGPQGAHWGVWDSSGNLKPGMAPVLAGQTMEDNWSNDGNGGGSGDPAIEFTRVPAYGSLENLSGRVLNVEPSDYKVAVYIYVSGWWNKPYWNRPLTTIQRDGTWVCDVTTGGVDQTATRIIAFLVPNGFEPPRMTGGTRLPSVLEENAIAKTEVTRTRE